MSKVLVTGGAGLQGSRLTHRLLQRGMEVTVADNFSRGSLSSLDDIANRIRILHVDLTSKEECQKAVQGMDMVYHLAAEVGGVEYLYGSSSMVSHGFSMGARNLLMDTNTLTACINSGVERLLYTSSACVYPLRLQMKPDSLPLREDQTSPADPDAEYGWAKLMGEILCQAAARECGLKVAIVRPFNVYGEGEAMSPGSHVIPELIRKAVRYPEEDFVVYGDGSQTRVFTHVNDMVEGLMACLERYSGADPINISTEEKVTIKALAKKIVAFSGKDIPIRYDPSRPLGARCRVADVSKAKRVLGWSAKVLLDDGLKKAFDWASRRYTKSD